MSDMKESKATSVAGAGITGDPLSYSDDGKSVITCIKDVTYPVTIPEGVPSEFADLDRLTSGFQKGELIIIGARPGMGKTTIGLNMACHIAINKNIPTAFFSLEMSAQALKIRILSAETGIDSSLIKRATGLTDKDQHKIFAALNRIDKAPFYFVDTPGLTIGNIMSLARTLKVQKKVEIIFLDYINIIAPDKQGKSHFEVMSDISRSLKNIARDLDIPVVAMSQLRREDEEDKPPSMADIHELGSIEQDADTILFLSRDRELNKILWNAKGV